MTARQLSEGNVVTTSAAAAPGGNPESASDEPPSPSGDTPCAVMILAAGQGRRMKSRLSKLLHPVAGRPMIDIVLAAAAGAYPAQLFVVVGHAADQVRAHLANHPGLQVVTQEPQLGTGHAVEVAAPALAPEIIDVLVLFGDQPLFTAELVAALLAHHRQSGALITMATALHPDGGQHGRVTRDEQGRILTITEARDVVNEQPGPKEINSGILCIRRAWLDTQLGTLTRQANGEYYLPELIERAALLGNSSDEAAWPVASVAVRLEAANGVNDRVQLAEAERQMRLMINERHMLNGVTIVDPASTLIDAGVTIGRDTTIAPFTILTGATTIGEGCVIGPAARIRDSMIADGARVVDSTIEESQVGPESDIGPYSHLRPGSRIAGHVHIGNYVEIKNATIASDTAVGHFSYLGDATIGQQVNIGAGTITMNFDGVAKHRTIVGDGAFIGCDTLLRAPVEVGAGAITGAGAVVTHDVAAGTKVVGIPARPVPQKLANMTATTPREQPPTGEQE